MIKFCRLKDKYGCFSNFSRHPIVVDGKTYLTTEHYYQSKKFIDPQTQDEIRLLKTAREAKDAACTKSPLRPDWEQVKYEIMKDALRSKAQQHDEVWALLLSTGNEEIAEESKKDYVWGTGADGTGKNLLGKAWMEIREELRRLKIPQ